MTENTVPAELLANQRAMFGITTEEAMKEIERASAFYRSRSFALTSILSDVQELIACGDAERARQLVNVVKLGLVSYVTRELDCA